MSSSTSKIKSAILLPVFLPAVIVIFLMVVGTISDPQRAAGFFAQILTYITNSFGWFYLLAVAIFLVFIVGLAISSWGNIRLGPDHAKPEYDTLSWFAMLFSAGYGIALLFYGVAEPVYHLAAPPTGDPQTIEAAKQAMQIAYFHWGFHIWAIYGVVSLCLAYFSFRHGLPLAMRSVLYPFIGDRIHGWMGHTVDTIAVLGTLFGIATTLGLSVTQINTGLNYLFPDIPVSNTVKIIAIVSITALATLSVVAGMDKGIKRLSMINIGIAVTLMLFVFIAGPTLFILQTFVQNTGGYLSSIVERTFSLQAYQPSDWIGSWTLFIFAWTIAWAPFVGLFIAKISRGRTIRQFLVGVMLIPTMFTFFWFAVFGDTALHMILVDGYTSLITDVQQDKAIALFKLYENLPFTSITSFLSVILIITFFVTSADSGALVVDSLASGGVESTPTWQRIFWASMQGLLAIVLLVAGGLEALQAASIISALPFAVVMLIGVAGLCRALGIEQLRIDSMAYQQFNNQGNTGKSSRQNFEQRLSSLIDFPAKDDVTQFIEHTVMNSMTYVKDAFTAKNWPAHAEWDAEQCRALFSVSKEGEFEFSYEVRLCQYDTPSYVEAIATENKTNAHYYRAEVFLKRGGQAYDMYGYDQDSITRDILDQFEKYLHFLHISPGILPWEMTDVADKNPTE